MAPVVRALAAHSELEPIVISTGQHAEMLQQVVELFQIPVAHHLSVMTPNQSLSELTARLLRACDDILDKVAPEFALVQGDTTTVLSASLACFYRGIPVGHVEAGLRTHDLKAPFPEEANRVLAGRLMALHFAPTEQSRDNLLREGVSPNSITVTGNTVIDALHLEVERQRDPSVAEQILVCLEADGFRPTSERRMVLITGHRRENFGAGFDAICSAVRTLAQRNREFDFVYPVHLNPKVKDPVHKALGGVENIHLIPPQPYSEFVSLLRHCYLALTDSGGVQEEAPSLGKPVLVMRETTERPEGVTAGTVKLVGAREDRIVAATEHLLTDLSAYQAMARAVNPYGDGRASGRIAQALVEFLRSL